MNRVISILASAIVDVVEFRRVWDRINPGYPEIQPINVPNRIRRLDHSRTYTLDDIVATPLLRRQVATKMPANSSKSIGIEDEIRRKITFEKWIKF